ncbi:hypothetical protein E2562_027593 [Oryza meyeriana var. granulata]|uniref:Uncharacterized protein n=1 Tax=Oryza meyeriana var. granulata TaxID=110450 RepID=A0A6G1DMW7_9ORYZ|nr:hypothetical protein E2562_027593 [Oryza meyeriana var. granulata]
MVGSQAKGFLSVRPRSRPKTKGSIDRIAASSRGSVVVRTRWPGGGGCHLPKRAVAGEVDDVRRPRRAQAATPTPTCTGYRETQLAAYMLDTAYHEALAVRAGLACGHVHRSMDQRRRPRRVGLQVSGSDLIPSSIPCRLQAGHLPGCRT